MPGAIAEVSTAGTTPMACADDFSVVFCAESADEKSRVPLVALRQIGCHRVAHPPMAAAVLSRTSSKRFDEFR
jgi:hypothetical protein